MTAGPILNPPEPGHNYTLRSDLAKLCLPQTFRDANKKLAWVNSICLLFLLIGLMGLKPPRIIVKPLTQPTEIVPVVFTPPEDPPETRAQPKAEDPEPPPRDQPADPPRIATVVAASPAAVAFAVPVQGPVLVAREARFASPPRASPPPVPPPKPANFNPRAATGGHYHEPSYPRAELLARHEGKILLSVVVDVSGAPSSVTVKDSCGWPALDRYAADWVRRNWQWVPGAVRYYHVPVIFRIQ